LSVHFRSVRLRRSARSFKQFAVYIIYFVSTCRFKLSARHYATHACKSAACTI